MCAGKERYPDQKKGTGMIFAARRQKRQALFCGFVLLYMAAMLLGPVVQIRYVFPAMQMLPALWGLLFLPSAEAA